MKNIIQIIIGLIHLLSWNANAQSKQQKSTGFILTCQFEGLPDGTKVYLRTQEKDTVSKTISKGNRFTFKGILPRNGRFHFIAMDTLVSKLTTNAIFVINSPMTVLGKVGQKEVVVTGSAEHIDYNNLLRATSPLGSKLVVLDSLKEINQSIRKVKSGEGRTLGNLYSIRAELYRKLSAIDSITVETNKKIILEWLDSHASSLYAPYVMKGYMVVLGNDYVKNAYNNLSPRSKESYYGFELNRVLAGIEASSKVKPGKIIPDFSLMSAKGEQFSVLGYIKKRKITLIDFWASWCKPCREEIPNMKKVYEAFHDKGFDIIGVSTDSSEAAWKKALEEDNVSWCQGRDNVQNAAANIFTIGSIPAFALVDAEGNLIAFSGGMSNIAPFGPVLRGEELYKTIENLLKEKSK